ncbi:MULTISPECIES: alanine--tRNA ligase [unclassified Lysobacter]|uniref:alanine--tRNA ligase n=1 Tax=unclassified Lysobacter TaxID=2635362 RepID=UPI0006F9621B|nr:MULTISPECIES: alanine--tRNA ligase [unclassified Lysobacter]KQZ67949.1 alanine--tRNA ligase [Lysobacter sp. Root559]KRC38275.1 alanine--tRNA ligase [Lysobacter sp. Root76]KRD69599.1 alanine--tRNA ligase [Lysobacter sp. Root96]
MKTTNEIRSDFLEFFRSKGHTIVPSAPLVPANDPTLLFTNSGMVQFKNVFLGSEKLGFVRAADVQRCLRAGGKHNDLDQVGYTARHHTFFEMLGNWSFGDYFKEDAIAWAWELLTRVWKLPAERLLVTVYHTDDEAFDLWHKKIGVPVERIVRIGDNKGAPYASDNFWQMADTGPCGPCTEIFYDHGEHIAGGPPGSPDEDGDRYIEIWNLVFMQFDRQPDGSLMPLPAPCVDTGMGLERLAAVLQHAHSNYEIDLFRRLIQAAAEFTSTPDLDNKSLRVIADHIRACSFLIVDGVLPSNEGRGYVLRRIIRRALRHGWMLGQKQPFFHRMVAALVEVMGEAYPELAAKRDLVERALQAEEERFAETLDSGMRIFDEVAARSQDAIPGADAFRLYDTYGFPVDLTADIARERGLSVDMAGFDAAMEEQKRRAREAGKFGNATTMPAELAAQLAPTQFLGYERLTEGGLEVVALLKDGRPVESIEAGDEAVVILDRTPFYAESGGQVGDAGELDEAGTRFVVRDTQKFAGQFHGHIGTLSAGVLRRGDRVLGAVDAPRRAATVLNHSATHLLHAALRQVLGDHVVQKGSLVAPDRLRFDFAHFQPLTDAELAQIERRVNAEVRGNHEAEVHQMGMQEALDFGALALFGEKYGDRVRVLRMGETSTELCGGTHVSRTGDIGLFKILAEGGVSAGVRRIEAVTGQGALDHVSEEEQRLEEAARLLGGNPSDLSDKLRSLLDRQKKLERELEAIKAKAASGATSDLAASAAEIQGVKVIATRLEGFDAKALREAVDRLKQQLGDAVILLAGASEGKAALVAGVNGSATGKVKAGELLAHVAGQINGKGGGRADMAQGGGDDGPALSQALAGVAGWVESRLI